MRIAKSMDYNSIPKIENHIHLEGAIPLESLWQLVKKYTRSGVIPTLAQLEEKFVYRDFSHFLEIWTWKNNFLREYEDFSFITDAVLKDLAAQNIKYAEIFFSPSSFRDKLKVQRIAETVYTSINNQKNIRVNLIVDLVRNFGPEKEIRTLYEINEVKQFGIIGIGIGGPEKEYPPEMFTEIYSQARKFGFRTTAHAGEGAGPESIWSAIRNLKAERIGHGTRAVEDDELLQYIADKKIPVELCPISNLRTKVIGSIREHPVRKFIEMGIPVSINTDDPKMFGNSLSMEYQVLQNEFNFTDYEISDLIFNSVHTTWLPPEEKEALIKYMRDEVGG
jgi:adenosine deaminase